MLVVTCRNHQWTLADFILGRMSWVYKQLYLQRFEMLNSKVQDTTLDPGTIAPIQSCIWTDQQYWGRKPCLSVTFFFPVTPAQCYAITAMVDARMVVLVRLLRLFGVLQLIIPHLQLHIVTLLVC